MTDLEIDTDQLLITIQDGLCTITLNRPDARNALSDELSSALRRTLAWVRHSDEVGAILITGAGKAFCAGGDVKAMGRRNDGSAEQPSMQAQFQALSARHHEIAGALRQMPKPSIAALPGPAAGAGLAIALACDLRIAARSAFLSTAYARIGLSGDYGVAWLLTRVVGPGRARELMLTAERVGAEQALAIGLVNRVVEDGELAAAASSWARALANGPQVAFEYIKANLEEALTIDHATAIDREADRLLKCRATQDHREAVQAFAQKRDPVFTGR